MDKVIKRQLGLSGRDSMKELARNYAVEAIHALAEIVHNEDYSPTARVQAAKLIIERAYGTVTTEPEDRSGAEEEQLTFTFEVDQ